MSNTNIGGPAFPTVLIGKPEGGMTLRDYFAAKAMAAIINEPWYTEQQELTFDETAPCIAADAYIVADAMLEARK